MLRIITDAAADMPLSKGEELNVKIVPLTVSFGEKHYKALYDITNQEFYKLMADSKEPPKTAQVSPFEFEEIFKEVVDAGDEAIVILISSELSGTYQSAKIAVDNLETDKITVIDSMNVSGAEGLLVLEAVRMRDQGMERAEIEKILRGYIPNLKLFILLDTLEYLKKGGRISPTVAFVGEAIKLRPIITVTDGKVGIADKAKGNKAGTKKLMSKLDEVPALEGTPIVVGHSDASERAEALMESLKEQGKCDVYDNWIFGPIVGTHAGPGAVGIYYIAK